MTYNEKLTAAIDTLTNVDASMSERVAAAEQLRELREQIREKVFRIHYGDIGSGAYIGTDIHEMLKEIDWSEAEEGEKYTIEVSTMTQDELDALPEFDGF